MTTKPELFIMTCWYGFTYKHQVIRLLLTWNLGPGMMEPEDARRLPKET